MPIPFGIMLKDLLLNEVLLNYLNDTDDGRADKGC